MSRLIDALIYAAALAVVLYAAAAGGGQSVRVAELPPAEWVRAGDARVGSVYLGASGELLMVVDPVPPPPDPSHYPYGVRPQPPRQYVTTTHTVPGYGTFTLTWPGPVYAVELRSGRLYLMSRGTWLRPAAWSLAAAVAGRE